MGLLWHLETQDLVSFDVNPSGSFRTMEGVVVLTWRGMAAQIMMRAAHFIKKQSTKLVLYKTKKWSVDPIYT